MGAASGGEEVGGGGLTRGGVFRPTVSVGRKTISVVVGFVIT